METYKELFENTSLKDFWINYDWKIIETRPTQAGRYLVYRQKCDKWHSEVWNGSGWASNNNDITHYMIVEIPQRD